ncbi:MAG: tetratricopeptide repeat-containing sensor histidine kinase [Flavobacterium sp.]
MNKLFLIFFLGLSINSFTQNNFKIDSINDVLKKKISDKERVKNLLDLAVFYQDNNISLAANMANKAFEILKKKSLKKEISRFYLVKSRENIFKRDYKKAFFYANKANILTLKIKDDKQHLKSCYYKAMVVSGKIDDYKATIKFIEKKIDSINKKNRILELGDLYFLLAASYSRTNNYNNSFKNFTTALKIYDENKYIEGVRNCYFEICDIYTLTNDYASALKYSNKILDLVKTHNFMSKINFATDLAKAGEINLELGNLKKAEKLLIKSLKLCDETGNRHNRWFIISNLIHAYVKLEKYQKVISICQTELTKENLSEEQLILLYNNMSISYLNLNKINLAESFIKDAIKKFEYVYRDNVLELKRTNSVYDIAARIYFKKGDYKTAYSYLLKYDELNTIINTEFNSQKIERLQTEFNVIDKELEIKDLKIKEQAKNIKIASQAKNILLSLSIILLFLILIIFIYIFYKNSKKNNIKLKKQSKIIEQKNNLLHKTISEKDVLIKEIHHRVKNNLQLVMCLLNIQYRKTKNKEIVEFIEKSQARITSIALIHQNLYNTENLSKVDFNNYLEQLLSSITAVQNEKADKIKFVINTNTISFDVQTAIPLGLIINELICNSLKYAFPNNEEFGQINISLEEKEKNVYSICYKDNGIGYNDSEIKSSSIGIKLINLLTQQLNGTIYHTNETGTEYKITFTEVIPTTN